MFQPVLPDLADHGDEDRHSRGPRRRRRLLAAALLALACYLAIQLPFRLWRGGLYHRLEQRTELIQTDLGPVEYSSVGEGPAVLYVHSGYGGADRPLTLEGYRTINPSRPGYLRTPLTVGATPAAQGRAFAVLLDSLGIDRVAVVSSSAGGGPALAFASQYPDRVWALILRSAITKTWDRGVPQPSTYRRVTDVLFGADFADWSMAVAVKLSGPLANLWPKAAAVRDNFATAVGTGPWSKRHLGFANDRRQMKSLGEPDLGAITAPTLIIHGTADRTVGLDQAESAARRIAGARLVTVEGANHGFRPPHAATLDSLRQDFLATHLP